MTKKTTQNKIYLAPTSATGGLFQREINALLPLLHAVNSQELLAREVKENNLLQINAQSTRSKVVGEIKKRISAAFPGFWDTYKVVSPKQQALMLFFLVLKTKALIFDFHFDVTIPAWKGSTQEFMPYNYQMKIDEIGNQHENVRQYTESTREQILKIYKRMLKESGFLSDNKLVKPTVTNDFFYPFIENGESWFLEACFLNQTEREKVLNQYNVFKS
jgi:hypothetical protein